jgi:hypothetical protein
MTTRPSDAARRWVALPALISTRIEVPGGLDPFSIALACHIAAGLTAVIAGAVAATAPKRPGRHPRFGIVYSWAVAVVATTALIMAGLRWPDDAHLAVIAIISAGAATLGYRARRRRRRGWLRWHMLGMATSYIALLTGFYVDNGPLLPLWNRLPPASFWFLPSAVGVPLLLRALRRHGASRPSRRGPDPAPRS